MKMSSVMKYLTVMKYSHRHIRYW